MNDYRKITQLLHCGSAFEAEALAKSLVAEGDTHGNALLGAIYEFGGKDLSKNVPLALQNYMVAMESSGNVEAALGYARIKYLGKDGPADVAEARRLYELVAQTTDEAIAHYMLAKIIVASTPSATELQLAAEHARKALQQGVMQAKPILAKIALSQHGWLQWIRWAGGSALDQLLGRSKVARTI